jgi:AcrR family transcriptional regulator
MDDTCQRTRKSDRTRAAIEAAAKKLFAAKGFEHTTVRDIAAEARIDPSMVIRYFGSKDALFARVAEFDLRLPNLSEIDRARIGEAIVRHFLEVWEVDHDQVGLAILLKSASSNEFALQKLKGIFAAQVVPALARVVDASSLPRRAALVASQLLGLALTRYVLKLPPVVQLPRETIVSEVGRTLQRYIFGA